MAALHTCLAACSHNSKVLVAAQLGDPVLAEDETFSQCHNGALV